MSLGKGTQPLIKGVHGLTSRAALLLRDLGPQGVPQSLGRGHACRNGLGEEDGDFSLQG